MNLSHGPLSAHKDWLDIIHAVGIPQLLIDLQGPELRIGTLTRPLVLEPGQSLRLGQGGVPCPAALVQAARPGQDLLLDDGRLFVQVAGADGAALQCTVVRGGTLQSRKSLAAPGLEVASPTLTEADLQLSLIHIFLQSRRSGRVKNLYVVHSEKLSGKLLDHLAALSFALPPEHAIVIAPFISSVKRRVLKFIER